MLEITVQAKRPVFFFFLFFFFFFVRSSGRAGTGRATCDCRDTGERTWQRRETIGTSKVSTDGDAENGEVGEVGEDELGDGVEAARVCVCVCVCKKVYPGAKKRAWRAARRRAGG